MFDALRKGADEVMLRVAAARKSLVKRVAVAVGEDRMGEEALKARAASLRMKADLQAQMVGAFTAYDATVRYARRRLVTETNDEVRRALLEDLEEVRARTERGLQASIRVAYREQFRLGKRYGWNWSDLDAAEEKFVERLRRDEYVFVRRFLDDIGARRVRMSIEQRAALYGNAGEEAFWHGYLYADQSSGRYLRWRTHEAEHCPDCLYLAGELPDEELAKYAPDNQNPDLAHGGRWGNGTYEVQELTRLGIVPQSGELRCTTNCKCHLEECERPATAPEGNVQRVPFVSLAPKPVEEPYASKRSGKRTKRVQRSGKVERGRGGLVKALTEAIWRDLFRG